MQDARDKNDCVEKLMANFVLDERQANAVAELRLYRLSHLEVDKISDELSQLEAQIADFNDILAKESRVLAIIKADLLDIKKRYPSERRTEIAVDYGEIEDADLIPVENVVISLTHSGYVKRLPVAEYKAQHRGGMGVTAHRPKEEDFIEQMFVASTHDDILLFSSLGKVYSIKGYEIPEAARTARGRAIVNIVRIAQDEKITAMIPVRENAEGYIAFATRRGLIKKTSVDEFARINKNGKIAIKLGEGDELISAQFTTGEDELMIASSDGKCIRFHERDVRAMGRDTAGVRAMKLGEGDRLVDMLVVDESKDILTVTSNGYGKRTSVGEYRLQGRAGKGVKAGVFNEATGKLVNLKLVSDEDDAMLISDAGVIIRMHCSDISRIGRNTRGVRLMKLKEGSVATVAVTERDDEAETEVPEQASAEDMAAESIPEEE